MAKNIKQITQLKYGELHIYYPIKFDTKLSYPKSCDTLYKSNINFNEKYQQKIMDSLGISLANTTNEFQHTKYGSDPNDVSLSIKVKDTGQIKHISLVPITSQHMKSMKKAFELNFALQIRQYYLMLLVQN